MRVVMMGVLLFFAREAAHGQASVDPLRALTKCSLSISIVSGRDVDLNDSERLRVIAEDRLRSLGIRVLTDAEVARDPASVPAFEVRATTIALTSRLGERIGTAFYLDLSLIEWTTLSRTHATAPAVLWTEGHLQAIGAESITDVLERDLGSQLNKFATAVQRANPSQKP